MDILNLKAEEAIQTKDRFGKFDRQLKGIAGTLHLTKEEDIVTIGKIAWDLAKAKRLPVVVVVRATD